VGIFLWSHFPLPSLGRSGRIAAMNTLTVFLMLMKRVTTWIVILSACILAGSAALSQQQLQQAVSPLPMSDESRHAALWKALRETLPASVGPILVYGENDTHTAIVFWANTKNPYQPYKDFYFDLTSRQVHEGLHDKLIWGINRITYKGGCFNLWRDESMELAICGVRN
jgi:hypothetical protein